MRLSLSLLLLALATPLAIAQPSVSILDPEKAWTFDNGREFPGAVGSLAIDPETMRDGKPALKLVGDFTKGGNYVQAGRKIDDVDIRDIDLWIKSPVGNSFTLRLSDGSGQTHQIVVKAEPSPNWQRIVLPLDRFFAKRGQADAVTSVVRYESWGGAKDGRWHGPAKAIYLLLGRTDDAKVRTFWIGDVRLTARPKAVAEVQTLIPIDDLEDWRFTRGEEFKGAQGSLTVTPDKALKLAGDFTGGGAYVGMVRELRELDVQDVAAIKMQVKSETASSIGVQMVDATGQTHQRSVPIKADNAWHELVLDPVKIAGGEHWGGANDSTWHGPPRQIALNVSTRSDPTGKRPAVELAKIVADARVPVFEQSAAYRNDFEADRLSDWSTKGDVSIDGTDAAQGKRSLLLARTLTQIDDPCSAQSKTFPAAAGSWEVKLQTKARLHSPDNSYSGVIRLEALDDGGKVIERFTVAEEFGSKEWHAIQKKIELPRGVRQARFEIKLDKTYGKFWVDDLSASHLAPALRKDDRIAKMLFASKRLGNLLLPGDPLTFEVTVETRKPLKDSQRTLSYLVRDYWGAEQMPAAAVKLVEKRKNVYEATIDVAAASPELGRYYEVHAQIAEEGGEPFKNYTSFAVLPESPTKKLKPEESPFTSRNWDNRITEYFLLSDRLGIRTCGIWGGWSAKPPYRPEAPGLERCIQLDMGVLTGTPASTIEAGKTEYDETALRTGVRNWLTQFGKHRPLIVSLGNEPHGTGQRVKNNVAAYKIVYEEIKKVDPTVFVVATSVEPNEEYFKLGYGNYCDAYDFHIYEGFEHVRKAAQEYQALMKKYGPVRPLWSTELGLNSQGLPRHTVAVEVTKTMTTFFASGGVSASWFGILYPDGDAKSFGSSGDSHNVFDCRYNRYAPRLDAIAYYDFVGALGTKKFVEEKQYGDIRATLFRDAAGKSLQVLWKAKGRADVSVPLAGVGKVEIVRVDGSRRYLDAGGKALTLTVSSDPLMLLYDGGGALPAELRTPIASVGSFRGTISRKDGDTIRIDNHAARSKDVIVPRGWNVGLWHQAQSGEIFSLRPVAPSDVRELDVIITFADERGELYLRVPITE
jgi:hypothetical protein